jgi:hypothetical protein
MSLSEVREVWKSGNTFGSTVDGLEELGSCFVEPLCSLKVSHGSGNGVELGKGNAGLEALGRAGQRA